MQTELLSNSCRGSPRGSGQRLHRTSAVERRRVRSSTLGSRPWPLRQLKSLPRFFPRSPHGLPYELLVPLLLLVSNLVAGWRSLSQRAARRAFTGQLAVAQQYAAAQADSWQLQQLLAASLPKDLAAPLLGLCTRKHTQQHKQNAGNAGGLSCVG